MKAVLCTLCVLLAGVQAAPSNQQQLKQSAIAILSQTEDQGGDILSEVLLGKHVENGITVYDPVVVSDFRAFLQQVLSEVTSFRAQVMATPATAQVKQSNHGNGNGRKTRAVHAGDVVLPPGTDAELLSYKDILDILGDYTKGFVETVLPGPVLPAPLQYIDRDDFIQEFNNLVDDILVVIKEVISL